MSLREAMNRLRDPIQSALARGYSYDELVQLLAEKGIGISASTLKNYIPAGKRQSAKDKKPVSTRTRRTKVEGNGKVDEHLALTEADSIAIAQFPEAPEVEATLAPKGEGKQTVSPPSTEEIPSEPTAPIEMETKPKRDGRGNSASTAAAARTTRGRKRSQG